MNSFDIAAPQAQHPAKADVDPSWDPTVAAVEKRNKL